jgi:hypothetical protein
MCSVIDENVMVERLIAAFRPVTDEHIRTVVRYWINRTSELRLGSEQCVVVEFAARGQLWREREERPA